MSVRCTRWAKANEILLSPKPKTMCSWLEGVGVGTAQPVSYRLLPKAGPLRLWDTSEDLSKGHSFQCKGELLWQVSLKSWQRTLQSCFQDPVCLAQPGGHVLPQKLAGTVPGPEIFPVYLCQAHTNLDSGEGRLTGQVHRRHPRTSSAMHTTCLGLADVISQMNRLL